jgi:PIN domain nuclease of toxin-antitoxin system
VNIILDTDALLWMSQGSSRLGREARDKIDWAIQDGTVRFSPISMLEATRLHWDGRIDLKRAPHVWHRELLDRGVREIPVTTDITILAASLEPQEGFHADPADQMITATAMVARYQLVTSDRKILNWASGRPDLECLDARN